MGRLQRGAGHTFIDVRGGERAQLLFALLTSFGIISAHTISETTRDALFLGHLPASRLPLAYVCIGVVSLVLGRLAAAVAVRVGHRAGLAILIVLGSVMQLPFFVAFAPSRGWLFYAYYVWVGAFATTSVVQLWLFVSTLFTVSQGKRLFGIIGAGASLGTVVGAGIAWLWVRRMPIASVLPLVAAILMVTALLTLRLPSAPRRASRSSDAPAASIGQLLHEPYLLHLAALVALAGLTLTLVDYQFKASTASAIPAAGLAGFLSAVYGLLGAAALVLHALSGAIVRRFGVAVALGALPALLVCAGLVAPIAGVLGGALLLRAVDGTLRHSLSRVGMELLYMPLSSATRTRIKAVLDGTVGRLAQAAASVLLLGLAAAGMTHRLLVACIVLGASGWLVVAWRIKPRYVECFVATLEHGAADTLIRFPALDGASVHVLLAALDSPIEAVAASALDLLAAEHRTRMIPLSVLDHPSAAVRAKAIEVLSRSGRRDLVAAMQESLRHEKAEVRIAAVRAVLALGLPEDGLEALGADPSPVVRALVAVRRADRRAIDEMATGSAEVRAALLQATGEASLIWRLADTSEPIVLRAASEAIARLRDPSFMPLLISWLGVGPARRAVRAALASFGGDAREALARALEDPSVDLAVRRQLPRTLSSDGSGRAAEILARNLVRQKDGVLRYKILRALCELVGDHPELTLDRGIVLRFTQATARRLHRLYAWRILLERARAADRRRKTGAGSLVAAILHDKTELGVQQLFRLLSLLHRGRRLGDIEAAIGRGAPEARAAALEVLENVLSLELRQWVMPLFDDMPDDQRLARIADRIAPLPQGYAELLRAIGTLDDTLDQLVARHAAELADVSAA